MELYVSVGRMRGCLLGGAYAVRATPYKAIFTYSVPVCVVTATLHASGQLV